MHGAHYIGSRYDDLIYNLDENALYQLSTLQIQILYAYTLSTGDLNLE